MGWGCLAQALNDRDEKVLEQRPWDPQQLLGRRQASAESTCTSHLRRGNVIPALRPQLPVSSPEASVVGLGPH